MDDTELQAILTSLRYRAYCAANDVASPEAMLAIDATVCHPGAELTLYFAWHYYRLEEWNPNRPRHMKRADHAAYDRWLMQKYGLVCDA